MIRNFKLLGLAISAMLLLGALGAASASAALFHSTLDHTTFTGTGSNEKFTVDAGVTECKKSAYAGTTTEKTVSTLSVTAEYKECTSTFGVAVTVDMNGCEYTFHTVTNGVTTNTVDIHCPEGKNIEVTAPGCVVTVHPHTGYKTVTFTNSSPTTDVTANVHITNTITYEEHNKGFFPTCKQNTVTKSNGSFTGTATIEGFNTNHEMTHIWYE
jgi:hypothetical protein